MESHVIIIKSNDKIYKEFVSKKLFWFVENLLTTLIYYRKEKIVASFCARDIGEGDKIAVFNATIEDDEVAKEVYQNIEDFIKEYDNENEHQKGE